MSRIIETIQTTSITLLLTILVTSLLTMIGTIWVAIRDPLANILINEVPKSILLLLSIVLLFLLILSVIYIVYLRKKIRNPIEDYEFDEKIGILHNSKDNLTYCISCLHKGIKSPLKVQKNGWRCLNNDCNKFYENPDYKAPVYQPIHSSRRNSIFDWDSF